MDSIGTIFGRFPDPGMVRNELFKISAAMKQMGITTVITTERTDEYGPVSRFGIEEFVADAVKKKRAGRDICL
jgi:circadian clock protein KaiC